MGRLESEWLWLDKEKNLTGVVSGVIFRSVELSWSRGISWRRDNGRTVIPGYGDV